MSKVLIPPGRPPRRGPTAPRQRQAAVRQRPDRYSTAPAGRNRHTRYSLQYPPRSTGPHGGRQRQRQLVGPAIFRNRVRFHPGNTTTRSVALLIIILLILLAIASRTAYLQVVASDVYVEKGLDLRVRSITLPADRGSIFDRNGSELAMSVPSKTVVADPQMVAHPSEAAAALAPLLGRDTGELEALLRKGNRFEYLQRQMSPEMEANVDALFKSLTLDEEGKIKMDHPLKGVFIRDEPKRIRPAGDLARGLLGGVDPDGVGYSGLEDQYDKVLLGTPGEMLMERDPAGNTIAGGEQSLEPAVRGQDLVLTIDRSLQYEVEQSLSDAIVSSKAKGAMAVVMNPRTGEILSMANMRAGEDGAPPVVGSSNAALVSTFEPGSVNKIITMAAALEEGIYNSKDVLSVPDQLEVSIKTFKDHESHEPMPWTLGDILGQSSNVGTIMIAQKLGEKTIDEYLRKFGLSSFTGLKFPKESRGSMLDLSEWTGTSIGSISIGQGVAVNALQMLGAFNIIANKGVAIPPKLVKSTVDSRGIETPTAQGEARRVISQGTASEINTMLSDAVAQGTGDKAQIDRYTVAGKTGTARKPSETSRGYVEGAYMASFVGFVPAQDPQLSAIVVIDEPVGGIYGGQVAAPVFAQISKYALRLLRIPPLAVASVGGAAR